MRKILLFLVLFLFSFSYVFSLKITEVYFDGTNEFIGIYNDINTNFSGLIYISGAKSSNISFDLNINPNKEIIIGDDIDNMLSGIVAYKTGLKLSISDTKAINIELLDKNRQVLDKFYVSGDIVNNLNNKKTSFSKIYSGGLWTIQSTQIFKNNKQDYKINPGYVFIQNSIDNSTNSGTENIGGSGKTCFLILKEKTQNNFTFVYSGSFESTEITWYLNNKKVGNGQSMSMKLSNGNSNIKAIGKRGNSVCNTFYSIYMDGKENINGQLKINEVHPKNGNFPEYLELKAYGNVSGNYEFINLGRGNSSINFPIKLYTGNILLIAKSYSGFVYTGNILLYDKMSLSDNGENLIIRQNGQDIDNVLYKGNSAYFSSFSGTTRLFYKEDEASPGYESYINKYKKGNNLNCYIKIQTKTTPFLSKDSINFITVVNGKEIQNSNTNYTCKYILSGQVLSTKCNPSSLKLDSGLHLINLEVIDKNKQKCQNVYYLNLPKENVVVHSHTRKSNINVASCISLSSTKLKDLVVLINQKYKSKTTLKSIFNPISYLYKDQKATVDSCLKLNSNELAELVGKISNKYKSSHTLNKIFSKVDFTKYKVPLPKIKAVLPYPNDGEKEKIILYGQYSTGLSIQVGNKTIALSNYSLSDQNMIFSGDFNIPNRSSCIGLRFFNNIVDYKCFEKVSKGQWIKKFVKKDKNLLKGVSLIFSKDNIIVQTKKYRKVFKNKKYINYKKKVNKGLRKILSLYKKKLGLVEKLKKQIKKLIDINVDRTSKYVLTLSKYRQLRKNCLIKNSKKFKQLKKKNRYIRLLKNQVSFLKSFIVYNKKNIDKNVYKDYLKKYKQVKKGQKIRY